MLCQRLVLGSRGRRSPKRKRGGSWNPPHSSLTLRTYDAGRQPPILTVDKALGTIDHIRIDDQIDAAIAAVKQKFGAEKLNTSDGVRIDFADGWVHLRASNTEPIFRVIAEATSQAAAEQLIARVRAAAGL